MLVGVEMEMVVKSLSSGGIGSGGGVRSGGGVLTLTGEVVVVMV